MFLNQRSVSAVYEWDVEVSVVNWDCLMEFMIRSTQYFAGQPNKTKNDKKNVGYQLYTTYVATDLTNIPESMCSFLWHTEAPSLATATGHSYKIKPLDLKKNLRWTFNIFLRDLSR